jgi:hypothetical protein
MTDGQNGSAQASTIMATSPPRKKKGGLSLLCWNGCDYYLEQADEIWTDFKEETIGKYTWKVYKGEIEEYGCNLHSKAEKDCFSREIAGDTDPNADLWKRVSGHLKEDAPYKRQGVPAKLTVFDAGAAISKLLTKEKDLARIFKMSGGGEVTIRGLSNARIWYRNGGLLSVAGDSIFDGGLWNMPKTAGGLKYIATATFDHDVDPEEMMTRLYRPRGLHHVACVTSMGDPVMDVSFEQRIDILQIPTKGFKSDYVVKGLEYYWRPTPVLVMKKKHKVPMKDGKDLSVYTVVMKTIKLDKECPIAKEWGTFKDCMILRCRGYAIWKDKETKATRVGIFSHEDPETDYYNVASSVYSRLSLGQASGGAWESATYQLERLVNVAPGGLYGHGSVFDTTSGVAKNAKIV